MKLRFDAFSPNRLLSQDDVISKAVYNFPGFVLKKKKTSHKKTKRIIFNTCSFFLHLVHNALC